MGGPLPSPRAPQKPRHPSSSRRLKTRPRDYAGMSRLLRRRRAPLGEDPGRRPAAPQRYARRAPGAVRLCRLACGSHGQGVLFAAGTEGVLCVRSPSGSHAPPGASHKTPFCSTGGTRRRPRRRSGGRRPPLRCAQAGEGRGAIADRRPSPACAHTPGALYVCQAPARPRQARPVGGCVLPPGAGFRADVALAAPAPGPCGAFRTCTRTPTTARPPQRATGARSMSTATRIDSFPSFLLGEPEATRPPHQWPENQPPVGLLGASCQKWKFRANRCDTSERILYVGPGQAIASPPLSRHVGKSGPAASGKPPASRRRRRLSCGLRVTPPKSRRPSLFSLAAQSSRGRLKKKAGSPRARHRRDFRGQGVRRWRGGCYPLAANRCAASMSSTTLTMRCCRVRATGYFLENAADLTGGTAALGTRAVPVFKQRVYGHAKHLGQLRQLLRLQCDVMRLPVRVRRLRYPHLACHGALTQARGFSQGRHAGGEIRSL